MPGENAIIKKLLNTGMGDMGTMGMTNRPRAVFSEGVCA